MRKKGLWLLALIFSGLTQAGTMGSIEAGWRNVITASGGPVWADKGQFQSIYFSPELSRTYTLKNSGSLLGEGELFAGRQRFLNKVYAAQLGVAFAGLSKRHRSGAVWDFDDPRFDNYRYSYDARHYRGVVRGKLLRNFSFTLFKPWISASLGFSHNKSTNYREWPVICEAESLPTTLFRKREHTAFTWSLGAGIQRVLIPHLHVGLGYEFVDWGQNALKGAAAQPAGAKGLSQNHVYTNGLIFNLTWLS